MKKLLAFIAAITLSVMALGAQAQKPSPGKMGGLSAPKMMQPPVKKGVTGTSVGTVKTALAGKTFVLKTAKSDVTVDISGSKVRNASGQFVAAAKITAGAPAEATGQWKGRTLFASSVTLTALKTEKKMGGPDAKGKMDGKMDGGKMGGGKMTGGKLPK